MPILDKSLRLTIPKGSRTSSAKVPLIDEGFDAIEDSLTVAFLKAITNFVAEHGHMPNWDIVNFHGGTTTFELIFEIVETNEQ